MKKLFVLIIAALICLPLAACKSGNDKAAQIALEEALKNETDLEFFILDDVADADLSGFQEIYGWFGAREYAPKRYGISDDGSVPQQIPEQCVRYLVSAWPDHADGGAFVTDITITDPKVRLFGLTIESSAEEFIEKCKLLGYKKVDKPDGWNQAGGDNSIEFACVKSKDGAYYIILEKTAESSSIRLMAPVSNKHGIQF